MNIPTLLAAFIRVEEGYDAKLSDPEVTPAEARQWRLRQLRRLQERAAEGEATPQPAGQSEAAPAPPELPAGDGPRPVFEPRSKGMGDLVMPIQLINLRGLAKSKGYDADEISRHFYHCDAHELNRETANILHRYIDGISPAEAAGPRRIA